MKRHLIAKLSVPEEQVVLEPFARHSTTNLRNAGRFLRAHGIRAAVVVTTPFQSFYFGAAQVSGFDRRCLDELGYSLGELIRLTPTRTRFVPAPEVVEAGSDQPDPQPTRATLSLHVRAVGAHERVVVSGCIGERGRTIRLIEVP
jgi:hypothetical protein